MQLPRNYRPVAWAVAACTCCAGVQAEEVLSGPWYVAPSVTVLKPDKKWNPNRTGPGLGLKIGRSIDENWDLRLGLESARSKNKGATYRQTLLGLDAVYLFGEPGRGWRPLATFGIGSARDSVTRPAARSNTTPFISGGLGLRYQFSRALSLQAEWKIVHNISQHGPLSAFGEGNSDNNYLGVALNYSFGATAASSAPVKLITPPPPPAKPAPAPRPPSAAPAPVKPAAAPPSDVKPPAVVPGTPPPAPAKPASSPQTAVKSAQEPGKSATPPKSPAKAPPTVTPAAPSHESAKPASSPKKAGKPAPVSAKPASAPASGIGKFTLQATELFEFNKSELRQPQPKLKELAYALKHDPSISSVVVTGHTDRLGSVRYNHALSQRRADSVKRYLVKKGVSPARIKTVPKGKSQPVKTCHDRDKARLIKCLAPNRRAVIEPITVEWKPQ